MMGQHQDGYTTLRNNNWQEVQIGESNYMMTKPTSPLRSPQSPVGPGPPLSSPTASKPAKLINYPAMPPAQMAGCENYMNMSDTLPSNHPNHPNHAYSNYVNINNLP